MLRQSCRITGHRSGGCHLTNNKEMVHRKLLSKNNCVEKLRMLCTHWHFSIVTNWKNRNVCVGCKSSVCTYFSALHLDCHEMFASQVTQSVYSSSYTKCYHLDVHIMLSSRGTQNVRISRYSKRLHIELQKHI